MDDVNVNCEIWTSSDCAGRLADVVLELGTANCKRSGGRTDGHCRRRTEPTKQFTDFIFPVHYFIVYSNSWSSLINNWCAYSSYNWGYFTCFLTYKIHHSFSISASSYHTNLGHRFCSFLNSLRVCLFFYKFHPVFQNCDPRIILLIYYMELLLTDSHVVFNLTQRLYVLNTWKS